MITIEIEQMAKRKKSHSRRKKDFAAVIDRFGCSSIKSTSCAARKNIIVLMFLAAGIAALGFIKFNGLI